MKSVIRNEVWETNSSTSHSVIIMEKNLYDKWKDGGLYYFDNPNYYGFEELPKNKRPRTDLLYTQEEVLAFYKELEYEYTKEDGETDEEAIEVFIREMGDFVKCDYWFEDEYLETDVNYYTTPGGENIVVTCKYGWDG